MITKKTLYDEYIVKKQSTLKIAKKFDCSAETIRRLLITNNIIIRQARKIPLDITNKKFGSLTVIEPIELNGKRLWECKCECGQNVCVRAGNLRAGNNTSCGCRVNNTSARHKQWKGCGEISGYIWAQIKWASGVRKDAKKRVFTITIKDAWKLYIKQNNKCALSGLPISFAKTANEHRSKQTTASLDRINSNKGYTKENVQWVHKEINNIKTDCDQSRFIELCKLVADYRS